MRWKKRMRDDRERDSELDFISGKFFDIEMPRDWKYLNHYFLQKVQRQFLRYYYVFGNVSHFADHTGHVVTKRWLRLLELRFKDITSKHKQAKESFNLEKLAEIESGNCKIKKR